MKIRTPKLVLKAASRRGSRRTATEGGRNARGVLRYAPHDFFSEKALDGFQVISKGTVKALKQLTFHH